MKRGDKVEVVLNAPQIADAETTYPGGIYSWTGRDFQIGFKMPMHSRGPGHLVFSFPGGSP